MPLKKNIQSQLRTLTRKIDQNERAEKLRSRDFAEAVPVEAEHDKVVAVFSQAERPLDPKQELPDNITPNQRRSIALKGTNNRLKHGIFSKQAPTLTCDNCYMVRSVQDENYNIDPADVKCPYYKPHKACIYACVSLDSNIRDIQDVRALMEEAVEMDMQRLQMARAIEVYDGGGVLDQSLDIGMERMVKNLAYLKEMYLDLEDRNKHPENKKGILSILLAGIVDAKAKVVDE